MVSGDGGANVKLASCLANLHCLAAASNLSLGICTEYAYAQPVSRFQLAELNFVFKNPTLEVICFSFLALAGAGITRKGGEAP
jgi:hypothetical protein